MGLFKKKKTENKMLIGKTVAKCFYKFDNDSPICIGHLNENGTLKIDIPIGNKMSFTSQCGKKEFILYVEKI